MAKKEYKDRYFSVLGDSLSTLCRYNPPECAVFYDYTRMLDAGIYGMADTWWGGIISALGAVLLTNNSIASSTVCKLPIYELPTYACSEERTSSLGSDGISPDVILVHIGTNDWGRGVKILPSDDSERSDLSVFSVAYGKMLDRLMENYPSAEIVTVTPCITKCSRLADFTFPYSYGGRHIAEYCDAIISASVARGCLFVDACRGLSPIDTIDGFHPTREGMMALSEFVLAQCFNK